MRRLGRGNYDDELLYIKKLKGSSRGVFHTEFEYFYDAYLSEKLLCELDPELKHVDERWDKLYTEWSKGQPDLIKNGIYYEVKNYHTVKAAKQAIKEINEWYTIYVPSHISEEVFRTNHYGRFTRIHDAQYVILMVPEESTIILYNRLDDVIEQELNYDFSEVKYLIYKK